jgi:hypothetical protein
MYCRMMGADGLRAATEVAILSPTTWPRGWPTTTRCCTAAACGRLQGRRRGARVHPRPAPLAKATGVGAEDVAKRLIDYGFHAPTLSFPVAGTLMVEPTESEPLVELDRFCDAMIAIRGEIAKVERRRMAGGRQPAEATRRTPPPRCSRPTGRTPTAAKKPRPTRWPACAAEVLGAGGPGRQRLGRPQPVLQLPGACRWRAAHLLDYEAPYGREMIYRFADFNAGHYASRNAAFQQAVSLASGRKLDLDGDLTLPGATTSTPPGQTETALHEIAPALGLDAAQIRRELLRSEEPGFERSALHTKAFALAEQRAGKKLPRAVLPRIELHSPKITRRLTTEWFAKRVDERYQRCLQRNPG